MLAIVEDEEDLFVPQRFGDRLVEYPYLGPADPEGFRDDNGYEVRFCDGREVGDPNAVGELVEQFCGELCREPRLADAARTDERHQAMAGEILLEAVEVTLATAKARHLDRQIVRKRIER